jgi:flagellar biosynthesis protein FlhG
MGLVDDTRIREEQARIAEAYDTLLEPARRRAYDLSVFPDDEPYRPEAGTKALGASEAEMAQLRAELARDVTPETQFTGALLRKAREAQGISLPDIASQTKISLLYLRAIEAEAFDSLPAPVYLRGFLMQIARTLRLEPVQVSKSYLKRVRAARPGYDE